MRIWALLLGLVLFVTTSSYADRDDQKQFKKFEANLTSYHEVHFIAGPPAALRGAISTAGSGKFKASIDDSTGTISYELSYSGLEGAVTQSHIHFGQRHTVGGIVVWLCQTAAVPAPAAVAAATPQCPTPDGTVTGTIVAAQVLAAAGQGIDAGEFAEVLAAIRAGATYANVHSSLFPPGEIRGQIRPSSGHNE